MREMSVTEQRHTAILSGSFQVGLLTSEADGG